MASEQPAIVGTIESFDKVGDAVLDASLQRSPQNKLKPPQKLALVPLSCRASGFPFFLENVVRTGAVAFNSSWDPECWSDCKRGRFYADEGDSGRGEALLVELVKEVRFLADKSHFSSVELIVNGDALNKLTSEATQRIELAFWDGEFDGSSAVQLVKALCPDSAAEAADKSGSEMLTKSQAIASLVAHRVPLMVFNDVDALVRVLQRGNYLRKASLDECASEFLRSYVLCNSAELESGFSKRKRACTSLPSHSEPKESMMSKEAVMAEVLRLKAILEVSEGLLAQERLDAQRTSARDAGVEAALASVSDFEMKIAGVEAKRKRIASVDRGQMGPPGLHTFKRAPLDLRAVSPVLPAEDAMVGQDDVVKFLKAFGGTLTDSLTRALGVRHLGGLPDPGTARTPYAKRLIYLDMLLTERRYIPFVEFATEAMKNLEMRLPSSKAKCFKVVATSFVLTMMS